MKSVSGAFTITETLMYYDHPAYPHLAATLPKNLFSSKRKLQPPVRKCECVFET